jgi:hypothetical protein
VLFDILALGCCRKTSSLQRVKSLLFMYCTSQFQVENNNKNDMPSIIFSGGKKPRENNRLRNYTRTSPFEFGNWPWKKNCGFSQLPACFSPDPPTSRLPSPSYNVTRITHPCIFVTRQIASETLNNDNCACCVYFYSHDCHVKFYEKGGQCTKFSFTLRRRRRNSVKSKLPGRLHGSLYTAL